MNKKKTIYHVGGKVVTMSELHCQN